MERTRGPVEQALSEAKLSADDIDEVILVGGSTGPAVQELVRRLTKGEEPNITVNPDEVVAIGAALQRSMLKGEVEKVVLLDVTPLSLGLETLGGAVSEGDQSATRRFRPAHGNVLDRRTTSPRSTSSVLQGERELAADNRQLAHFRLRGHPAGAARRAADRGHVRHRRERDLGTSRRVTSRPGKDTSPRIRRARISTQRRATDGLRRADAHASKNRQQREEIDARNELELRWAYRVDQLVTELRDQLRNIDKARAEQLVAGVRARPSTSRPDWTVSVR